MLIKCLKILSFLVANKDLLDANLWNMNPGSGSMKEKKEEQIKVN